MSERKKSGTIQDPFTTEIVRPYGTGDKREWGLCVRQDIKMGQIIFDEQALVHWSPLSSHTCRPEFDHWQHVITQGGTTDEFLTWKWIYEWAIRQAYRDRNRVALQRQQDKKPEEIELSLTGWIVQLLEVFGLTQKELSPRPVTSWAIQQAQIFHTQYTEQCRQLKIACQSLAEIEMAFRILYWMVHHFQWITYDALTETPQSWSVLAACCRIRPSCHPSAMILFKSVSGITGNREIQMAHVVALSDMKRGEEITVSVFPSQLTNRQLVNRPAVGCGCGGFCIPPNDTSLLSPPPLSTILQNEWMKHQDTKKAETTQQQQPPTTLSQWRPIMIAWFRNGPPSMDLKTCEPWISNLTSQLNEPTVLLKTNLIWFMYYRTCRFMVLYPIKTLQQLMQVVELEAKKPAPRTPDSNLYHFWKAWTDFFPENSITPTLRGSFRPIIAYPYIQKWWTMGMDLYQRIGALVWHTDALIKRWNR